MTSRSIDLVQNSVLLIMRPIVRWLLRHGITYGAFSQSIKQVFYEQAIEELKEKDMQINDSAISVLSGIHRRDVKAIKDALASHLIQEKQDFVQTHGPVSQVVAKWSVDTAWTDDVGMPKTLAIKGGTDSFATLVQSVNKDVRPQTILNELVRLDLVAYLDKKIILKNQNFTPKKDFAKMTLYARYNLHDHIAAALSNVEGKSDFLEQAVFVDEISEESAKIIQVRAKEVWKTLFHALFELAQDRYTHDQTLPIDQRKYHVRLGIYSFEEST